MYGTLIFSLTLLTFCVGNGSGSKKYCQSRILCTAYALNLCKRILYPILYPRLRMSDHRSALSQWLFPGLKKVTLPAKVLSSFALTTQPHQNIGNRSHERINDTNKQANSYVHPPQSWTWQFKRCICYKFFIFLTNYFVMVLTICGKWLGWHIIQRLTSR